MALQMTVSISGVEVTDAYHVVSRTAWVMGGGELHFELATFKDAAAANAYETDPRTAAGPLGTKKYRTSAGTYAKGGDNAHKQAYTYLKTLDEWSGAVDLDP